ncbi:hypothetical protein niasHT_028898 [Heterodera trifolii]|uniref:Peptidase A2 domain-containing protein n=1 Tax=Heterodera trifolii TaxID=157864 RepID=A0ABD2KFL3_9BILA
MGTARTSAGLPHPGTFDGTADFHNYLKSFNLVATAHGWTPVRCAQILPLYLRGSARAIYDGLLQDDKSNWKTLVDALATNLKKVSSSLVARQMLAKRKQHVGESLDEFAQEIRTLVSKAYPDTSLEMNFDALVLGDMEEDVKREHDERLKRFRSGIAKDFFRSNMTASIKEKILFMDEPQTFEEAITQAKRVQQMQGALAEDLWKQTQGTKAEVALAEINAVRTELNEMREEQKMQEDQRVNFVQRTDGMAPQRYGQQMQNAYIQRGNSNRGFRGRTRGFQSYRGSFNPQNSNQTPLGNRFQQNNFNPRPYLQQNQNWAQRGRTGAEPNRGMSNDNSGGRGRGSWRINGVNFPFICLLTFAVAIMTSIPPALAQYQICPTSPLDGSSVTLSFPAEQNCTLPTETQPIMNKSILYIPIRIPRSFPVFKCWNVTTVACTESFLRVVTLDHPPKKFESETSLDDCQNSLNHRPMNRISEKRWESFKPLRKEYGWYGVNCYDNVQTVIEEGTGGILDGEMLVTSWGDSLKIEQHFTIGRDDWIRLPGAVELLMWRIPSGEYWDTHFPMGPVTTETWPGQAVVVHELQYTFPISKDQDRKNHVIGVPREAIKMDNNVLIHYVGEAESPNSNHRQKRENENGISQKRVNAPRIRSDKKPNTRRGQSTSGTTTIISSTTTTAIPPIIRPTTTIIPPTIRTTTTAIPPIIRPTTTIIPPIIRTTTTAIPPTTRTTTTPIPPITRTTTTALPPTTRTTTTPIPPITRTTTTALPPTTRITTTAIPPIIRSTTTIIPPTIRITTTAIPPTTRTTTTPTPPITRTITTAIPPTTRTTTTPIPSITRTITTAIPPTSRTTTTPIPPTTRPTTTAVPPTTHVKTGEIQNVTIETIEKLIKKLEKMTEKRGKQVEPTPFLIPEEVDEKSPTTVVSKRDTSAEESESRWEQRNLDHENSRLNYLGWRTHLNELQNSREKWFSDCNERKNALAVAKALARQMPEDAARSLYRRDDITAFWAKSTALDPMWTISLCRQVKAENILWDQKVGGKCYRELPIIASKAILFVKVGTRDLTKEGKEVKCDKDGSNPWAANFNATTEGLQQSMEHRFAPEQFTNRQNPFLFFTKGSIFESEQLRLEQSLKDMSNRMTRPELDFTDARFMDLNFTEAHGDSVAGIFSIGEILVENAQNEAEKLRKKAEVTIEKGKAWIEDPIGIVKYVKWTGITIITILILVGAAVLFVKIKIYATALMTPLQIIRSMFNTIVGCFTTGRKLAEQVGHPMVMEVELEERAAPSAPPEDRMLEQKAYVLNYMPKIYQVHQNERKKKRCYLNVTINGKDVKALFDTGADITYVRNSTANQCMLNVRRGDFPQARAANKTAIRFFGSALAEIKLGEFEGKFPLLVSEDDCCPCAAIIGTDLMDYITEQGEEEEIGLNFKKGSVRIGHIHLPMVAAVTIEKKPIEIRLQTTQTLPPFSDTFVWGQLNRSFDAEEIFITTEREHQYFPLRVGKCLASPGSTRNAPLRLLNFGNCPIKVHAGSRLGILEAISDATQINSLKEEDKNEDPNIMNEAEWSKFKAEIDHIPPEADWTDQPLEFPKQMETIKSILERTSLKESILTEPGIKKLEQIIKNNENAFVKPGEVGLFKGKTIHRIDLIDGARPVQQKPYRYPVALQPEIERQVKELLRQNVIRPSNSAWSSPIVLVRKTDGSYRFCVDYRKLNQLTKRSTYYLPRIQSILDEVSPGRNIFRLLIARADFSISN